MDKEMTKQLSHCPLFAGMSESEISRVMETASWKIVTLGARDLYALAGMPCRYADIIVEGEMVARMAGLSGRLIQIDRLGVGTLVAPAFIFAKDKRMPVSVETTCRTRILRMRPEMLEMLIDTEKQLRMNFIHQLSHIDVFLTRKIRVLSLFTVREKVAYFLLKAAERQQSRTVRLTQSRQELADMFGIQKFSLLRCLSEFQERGAIEVSGKDITILDAKELNRKA